MLMQIERVFYPVRTLGYGTRIGMWTIGCPHACFNCSNSELWVANPTKEISLDRLFAMFASIKQPIDGLTITGGEPFAQPEALHELVRRFIAEYSDDILIYSGYTLEELKAQNSFTVNGILEKIAVLIDGKYIEALNDNRPLRGSANQQVHILNEKYRARYENLLTGRRTVQTVFHGENVLSIGIPMKEYKHTLLREWRERYGIEWEHVSNT
jgi:anaerobic ribonucleoside-triphosphate reductase activating protein